MIRTEQAAAWIIYRYSDEHSGILIDELKLHILLYFAQRESFILTNEKLFAEPFLGWRYGPVLSSVRKLYKEANTDSVLSRQSFQPEQQADQGILEEVYRRYGNWDSWSLARLSQGENSWKNSRTGLSPREAGNRPIQISDIEKDALFIQKRIAFLESQSCQQMVF